MSQYATSKNPAVQTCCHFYIRGLLDDSYILACLKGILLHKKIENFPFAKISACSKSLTQKLKTKKQIKENLRELVHTKISALSIKMASKYLRFYPLLFS